VSITGTELDREKKRRGEISRFALLLFPQLLTCAAVILIDGGQHPSLELMMV